MRQLIAELYPTRKAMKSDYRRFDVRISVLLGADKLFEREVYAASRNDARKLCETLGAKPWNF